ncbi:MAG TPA: Trm112 family protein [Tepidisphaeraceae bacterium]|jgi:hypothetical protein|nr:Trm112 family protein [Tepidisphaeraceae bacterium]
MADSMPMQVLDEETLSILRCPVTRGKLKLENGVLIGEIGGLRYPVRNGIPVLLAEEATLPAGIESLEAFRERFGAR